jgi:hypothetical protein
MPPDDRDPACRWLVVVLIVRDPPTRVVGR